MVDKVHNHETCTEDHEHSILTQDNDGDGVADVLQDETLWTEESAKALFTLYDKDANGCTAALCLYLCLCFSLATCWPF